MPQSNIHQNPFQPPLNNIPNLSSKLNPTLKMWPLNLQQKGPASNFYGNHIPIMDLASQPQMRAGDLTSMVKPHQRVITSNRDFVNRPHSNNRVKSINKWSYGFGSNNFSGGRKSSSSSEKSGSSTGGVTKKRIRNDTCEYCGKVSLKTCLFFSFFCFFSSTNNYNKNQFLKTQ